jgi:hypothetical protein
MDKENGNRKRSTEGKVATERVTNGKVKGQKKKRKREELLGDVKKSDKKREKKKDAWK